MSASRTCDETAERLAASWAGELDAAGRAALDAHLAECAACRAEAAELGRLWRALGELPAEEPDPRLRARFAAMLAAEVARERGAGVLRPRFGRPRGVRLAMSPAVRRFAALAAVLVVGVLAGSELARRRDDRQLEALRGEVASLHATVTTALLAGQSSSERLRGVAYGREASALDPQVAEALIEALRHDPDVNVRLAALEALRPLAGRAAERPKLVAALDRQSSPLVQLSLIDVLLESDGAAARGDLARLLDDANLDPAVRGYLRSRLGKST